MTIKKFRIKNKKIIFSIVLFSAIAFVYGKTLNYDYVYFDDDRLVLDNYDLISDYKKIPAFFTKSVFNSKEELFYRPLLTLSFSIDAMISGKNPFMYHFTGLLLHCISVFLLFVFFRKLNFDENFSMLFTLLFAVHPAFGHAVAWIPGRNDTLLTVALLLTFIFTLDYFASGKKNKYKLLLAMISFFAAMFIKETSIIMLAMAPLFIYVFCKNPKKADYLKIFFFMLLIVFLYMILRNYAVGGQGKEAFAIMKWFKSIFQSMNAYFIYIEYLMIPSRIYVIPELIPLNYLSIVSLIFLSVPLIASLFFATGRKHIILFGYIWFFTFLLPTLVLSDNYWYPHRLYFASIGIIIAFIEFVAGMTQKNPGVKKFLLFLIICMICIFISFAYVNVNSFKNNDVFVSSALKEQPESSLVKVLVSKYYAKNGLFKDALNVMMQVKPDKTGQYSKHYAELLIYIYAVNGMYDESEHIIHQMLAIFPENEVSLENLSEIYFLQGRYKEALALTEKLQKIRPERKAYMERYQKIKDAMAQN